MYNYWSVIGKPTVNRTQRRNCPLLRHCSTGERFSFDARQRSSNEQKTGTFARTFSSEVSNYQNLWRPRRDLNPCYRRERPVSWAELDDGDVVVSRAGFEPATLCLKVLAVG